MKKSEKGLKDLRYRLRKRGYDVIIRCQLVILPEDESQRSKPMEERIVKEFKYRIQYRMPL